jgi:hypothetical protein
MFFSREVTEPFRRATSSGSAEAVLLHKPSAEDPHRQLNIGDARPSRRIYEGEGCI